MEETDNLNRPVTSGETKLVIKLPANKSLGPESFMTELYQTYRQVIPILLKLSQKTGGEGALFNSFYEATITLIPKSGRHYKKKKKQKTTNPNNYRSVPMMNIDLKILKRTLANKIQQ